MTPELATKLMAYADGELEGAELEEIDAVLARDPDAAQLVSELGELGALVREGHAARDGEAIAAFSIADDVISAVADIEPDAPSRRVSIVTSLDAARAKRAQRLRVGAGVVGVLALAAAVFLVARPKGEEPLAQRPVAPSPSAPSPSAPSPGTPSPSAVLASDMGPAVQVEAVESAGQSVSVFYFPSESELSTSVVVWVDETGEK